MRGNRLLGLASVMALLGTMPTARAAAPGGGRKSLADTHRNSGSRPVSGGGEKERARRRAQIAGGQLKAENGVVLE